MSGMSINQALNFILFSPVVPWDLTKWSTVLLEKLTVAQLVKKFPTFYGT